MANTAGVTCKVTVRFSPTSVAATKAAALTVGGDPGDSVVVTLSGASNP
jgi:hypothetical protein